MIHRFKLTPYFQLNIPDKECLGKLVIISKYNYVPGPQLTHQKGWWSIAHVMCQCIKMILMSQRYLSAELRDAFIIFLLLAFVWSYKLGEMRTSNHTVFENTEAVGLVI